MIAEQWALLRQQWRSGFSSALARTAIAFLILTVIGFGVSLAFPELLNRVMDFFMGYLMDGDVVNETGTISAGALLRNNLTACFYAISYGLIPFLYLPAATLGINATLIGAMAAYYAVSGLSPLLFLAALLPHGIFELPALVISFTAGLELCRQITGRCLGREGIPPMLQCLSDAARLYLFPVLPLLAVAALMEAYVTPWLSSFFLPI